ncbi:PREDICTED: dnaJ homolog subfamily C member 12-like [Priapulus caudatus]|uniref:DnaJ homolog subfamily C member 12-like n=1 Tax=Priapulus caudatus TaxID=37621 RepID=A0ABM1F515_PRICU|nr:PREDICTED: dnaJ homolog subfamily C member 12-like [Priapulus caudatus]
MEAILNYERKEEDDLYNLLGCDERSTTEQISAEYRARVLDCHPDKNQDDPKAAETFRRLQRARDVLTDAKLRASYDRWRLSGIAIPYERWMAMSGSVHASMHWATRTKKDAAIESAGSSDAASHAAEQVPAGGVTAAGQRLPAGSLSGVTSVDVVNVRWERASAHNSMLSKFRNYEI